MKQKNEELEITNIDDETPNLKETIIGLIVGIGYLSFFALLPYAILLKVLGDSVSKNILSTVAQLITAVICIVLMLVITKKRHAAMKEGINNDNILYGAVTGAIMYGISIVVSAIEVFVFGDVGSANQNSLMEIAQEAPGLFIILTCFVAPFIEELIFRYFIFKPLSKKNVALAFVVSTLLFALVHFTASISSGTLLEDLKTLPSYVIPSIALAFAYYKTNHIATTITAHVIYNSIVVIITLISLSGGLV